MTVTKQFGMLMGTKVEQKYLDLDAGELTNWERLPPGFRGLGDRLVIEEADCSPELKELSRQIWVTSIGPAIQAFRNRY
jgi:hypothetical protein